MPRPRKQEELFAPAAVDLPPALDVPAFREAWQTYWDWRLTTTDPKLRLRDVPGTQRMYLRKLARYGVAGAIAALEHSAAGGYQGLFPAPAADVKAVEQELGKTTAQAVQADVGPLHDAARRAMRADPDYWAHQGVGPERIQAARSVNDFPAGLRSQIHQAHRHAGHRTPLP